MLSAAAALSATAAIGCGGGDNTATGTTAEPASSPIAALSRSEYQLAVDDLGRAPSAQEARAYLLELNRLKARCTNPPEDVGGMASAMADVAAENHVKVTRFKVLRNVGLEIPDGERRDCSRSYRLYLQQLLGP